MTHSEHKRNRKWNNLKNPTKQIEGGILFNRKMGKGVVWMYEAGKPSTGNSKKWSKMATQSVTFYCKCLVLSKAVSQRDMQ